MAAVQADDYGSGKHEPWENNTTSISPPAQIHRAMDADGLFMFGDSIAVQDAGALAERLRDRTGDVLAVHNWSGRATSPAVDALAAWARDYGLPGRILMATGANDVFHPPVFAEQIDRAMALAGPTRTVLWVNVHVARTGQPADVRLADQRNSAWVNLQLADAQRCHPHLRIVRWAEFLAAEPSRLATHLSDGVHTTVPVGQDARNELIVQAVERDA